MVLERIKETKNADESLKRTSFERLVKDQVNMNRRYALSFLKWKTIASKYPYLLMSSLNIRQIHNHQTLVCEVASSLESSSNNNFTNEIKNDEMETDDEIY